MIRRAALVWGVLAAGACGGKPPPSVQLLDDARHYEEGLRWQRFDDAASHVPPGVRSAFLEERERLSDDMNISEYEIRKVSVAHDQAHAHIVVRYRWYLNSVGLLKDTTVEQEWESRQGVWTLLGENYQRGDRMPGVGEKLEVPPDAGP